MGVIFLGIANGAKAVFSKDIMSQTVVLKTSGHMLEVSSWLAWEAKLLLPPGASGRGRHGPAPHRTYSSAKCV